MLTKIRKQNSGFTIVEVMIVLAIAGLIMLVVLMAVPALNRTKRNNQRRTDVSNIMGALSEYTNNNNGSIPTTQNFSAIVGTANNNYSDALAKLSFYAPGDIDYENRGTVLTTNPGNDANIVYIRNFAKCNGNDVQSNAGATRRNIIAFFFVETSNGTTAQCQEG